MNSQGKEVWLGIQKELCPAKEAMLLLLLCDANATIADFLAAYASPDGAGSVRRALEIVTAPKPSPSRRSMPVDWRN